MITVRVKLVNLMFLVEANDMEEGYRSVHDDDSGDDNAKSEGSEEENNDDSNEQGTDYSVTVNAVHKRLIFFT